MKKKLSASEFQFLGKFHDFTGLEIDEKNLAWWEVEILKKRRGQPAFWEMPKPEAISVVSQIIHKGAAITGGELPPPIVLFDISVSEIFSFLVESGFDILSAEEIYFALRLGVTEIKWSSGNEILPPVFQGKYFNLKYVADCLNTYLKMRTSLERKIYNELNGY